MKSSHENMRKKIWASLLFLAVCISFAIILVAVMKAQEKKDIKEYNVPATCSAAPAMQEDRRANRKRFKLVNFNAEWLFVDGGSGSMKCPGDCPWKTKEQAMKHAENVIETIKGIDADFVHLSEVESCSTLHFVGNKAGGSYKHYLIPGTDSATGQNVGFLTKMDPVVDLSRTSRRVSYPIAGSACKWTRQGSVSVSKHYVARIKVGEKSILIIGLHLLAFPGRKDRCAMREAQATVVKELVDEHFKKGDSVILLGDFNDIDNDSVAADQRMSISKVLPILKRTKAGFLRNVLEKVPQKERYSAWNDVNRNCIDDGDKEHSLIDHILVSADLFDMIETVTPLHVFEASCQSTFSDHWPVAVTFKLE